MTNLRPLERNDLDAVAALHAHEQHEPSAEHAERLRAFFERTLVDAPYADAEIPSLVAVDGEEIVGFLGSNVHRMEFDGEPLRVACSAHLLTSARVRAQGVGAILLRAFLDGPQDLSITDGATREVQRMWQTLGGTTSHLQCFAWIEPLRPAALGVQRLAQRFRAHGLEPGLRPLTTAVDVVAGRFAGEPSLAAAETVAASPQAFADALAELAGPFRLRPAYDAAYLEWLFAELDRSAAEPPFPDRIRRGPVHAMLVHSNGRLVGAFVAQLPRRGACRVLSIAAAERHVGTVLTALRKTAESHRASAIFGRLEPHLVAGLASRRVLVRFGGGRLLLHSSRREVLDAPRLGEGLLTRLDGEWW